jgi:hypothetical protein
MRFTRSISILAVVIALTGCGRSSVEVADPFYLMDYGETDETFALFRCLEGSGKSCFLDNGFGPGVVAAGGNVRFIAFKKHGAGGEVASEEYFYFARTPYERGGWGLHPEKLIGPLDQRQFNRIRRQLGLPELSVTP